MENLDTMPTSLAVFHVPWAISERFLQCGRGRIVPLKSGSAVAMRGCNWPVLKTYFIQGWCVIFCHAGGMWRVGACNFKQRAFFSFCDHPSLFPVWTLRLDQCSKTPTQTESILLNTWRKNRPKRQNQFDHKNKKTSSHRKWYPVAHHTLNPFIDLNSSAFT